MITAAGAAGAMIGLVFVALSVRSEYVFGAKATVKIRLLASSCFTGLVNAFSLSLLAIIPQPDIGVPMIILAVICLYNTLRRHVQIHRNRRESAFQLLALSTLTYLAQFAGGVVLIIHQHTTWIVNGLCYVIFASFVIALARAWDLIQLDATPTP